MQLFATPTARRRPAAWDMLSFHAGRASVRAGFALFNLLSLILAPTAFGSEHPRNVYVENEDVSVPFPTIWATWRRVADGGLQLW